MSLQPHSGAEIPPLTARVTRAANPKGTTAIWIRDRLDGLWRDEDFAAWYPRDGRPGLSPAQLATVCVLQYAMNLSDRQAAEAVRCRIYFTYAPDWTWTIPASTTASCPTSATGSPKATAPTGYWASRSPGSDGSACSRGASRSAPTPPTSCPPHGS
ncbi:transposase [Streptomyces phaeochromogenes]